MSKERRVDQYGRIWARESSDGGCLPGIFVCYHKEKATFCIEQANQLRLTAEAFEVQITEEEAGPFITQPDDMELATQYRTQAANWLRMSAACMDMPVERKP